MKLPALIIFLLLTSFRLSAQQPVTEGALSRLIRGQSGLRQRLPIEKLYVQTDKPNYTVGDTIWLKAYLFDADYLKYSPRSGLLYIELANDSSETVKRTMLPVGYGISHGQIAIDGKDIPPGSYTLRAYTNWQRNFGEDYVFKKDLYITAREGQPWLVKVNTSAKQEEGKETVQATLTFSDGINPLRLKELQLRVKDGSKTLFRGTVPTDMAGAMALNFTLPAKASTNNLNIEATAGARKENIPIQLTRPENTDLQFLPEGGSLVAGITTRTGFKAIGEDGRGINVSGKVYNSQQQQVAAFSSTYKGMGSFILNPKANESYTAQITLPNNQTKSYALPPVKTSGTVMNIQTTTTATATAPATATDSIKLRLTATETGIYYLTGQARGVICYAEPVKLETYARIISLPQSLFPTGIARFSLLNGQGIPQNERIVYIDHQDNLQIAIQTDKRNYTARDSMALHIQVKDKAGKPVQGSFSLAVTDDEQVAIDSNASNLTTSLLLTPDLKGTVEAPGYYLQNNTQNRQALDNLLLTQGWTGYDWQQVTGNPQQPLYGAEPEFEVKGRVTNILGKGVDGANIILLSKRSAVPKISQADKEGRFVFTDFAVVDTAQYFLKATNKKGKDPGMGITVDETVPPEFGKPKNRYLPWYINTDTAMQKSINKGISSRMEEENVTGNHVLKQVEIKAKKIIKGSHNLNGPGEADLVLDERDIKPYNKMTLTQLLELAVPKIKIGGFFPPSSPDLPNCAGCAVTTNHSSKGPIRISYMLEKKEVHFVIDGIDLDKFWHREWEGRPPDMNRYSFMKGYLDSYPAKDIIGVEVMFSSIYDDKYNVENLTSKDLKKTDAGIAYIEITTRTGVGPQYRQVSPGTYTYESLQWNVPKQFYRPRYIVKTPDALKDLRSTIHWEPLVITDAQGKATVSFYTSDRPNNYTLIMEGSDMNGNVGSVTKKLLLQ